MFSFVSAEGAVKRSRGDLMDFFGIGWRSGGPFIRNTKVVNEELGKGGRGKEEFQD